MFLLHKLLQWQVKDITIKLICRNLKNYNNKITQNYYNENILLIIQKVL